MVDTMASSIALFHDYTCTSDWVSVCHTKAQHMISLRTRPLAWGGSVWAHAYIELSQDRMLTRPMTVIDGQWRHGNGFLQTFTCSLSLTADMANRCAMLCYLQLCGKVEGSNEQDSSDHMHSYHN